MGRRQKKSFCKDCEPSSKRSAPYPGPRCHTHHREKLKAQQRRSRARHVEQTYGITEEQYQELYEAQDRRCYLCQRAKGTGRKRLAVDHDHSCCPEPPTCGRCVRGLLCKTCNRMIGHLRDNPEAFERGAEYLRNPPANRVLRENHAQAED